MRGQNVTADLQDLAALVGSSWPYETAAGVLERLSGVQLSEERLRQLTNEQGTALAKRQHSEAQRGLKEAIDMSEIRAQREHSQDTRLPNSVEWLQVGRMGGGCLRESNQGGWKARWESWPVKSSASANRDAIGSRNAAPWRRLAAPDCWWNLFMASR